MRRRALMMIPVSILLLLGGAAGSGCSDSNASAKLDGGGPDGIAVVTLNCGDPNQAIDPTALIDDMEAPAFATVMEGGRNGAWWAGGDPMSTAAGAAIQPDGDADAESIPGGRCGSKYAEHVTGHGFSMWAVLSVS